MAAIPWLLVTTESWQAIYGSAVIAITGFAALTTTCRIRVTEAARAAVMLALLIVPILASIIVNSPEDSHLANVAVLVCYAALGLWLFPEPRDHAFDRFHMMVTLAMAIVLPIAVDQLLADPDRLYYSFERGTSRDVFQFGDTINAEAVQPNAFAQYCVVIAFAAQALRHQFLRAVAAVFALALCALLSSRGAMLGVAIAFLASEWLLRRYAIHQPKASHTLFALMAAFTLAGLIAVAGANIEDVTSFVADRILLVNDVERGVESGATGRIDLWQAGLELWLDNPVFGVGFKNSTGQPGIDIGVHNIVLAILADTGAFGLICFFTYSALAIVNARQLLKDGERKAAVYIYTMSIVFYVYGSFEGNNIGVANPVSIIYFIVTFASCVRRRRTS